MKENQDGFAVNQMDEVHSINSRLVSFNEELVALQDKYKLKLIAVPLINGDGLIVGTLQALDHDEINKRLQDKLKAKDVVPDGIIKDDIASPYNEEEKN